MDPSNQVNGGIDTPARPDDPHPTRAHKRLAVFVGQWFTEGRLLATAGKAATTIEGVDSYEWLDGGFFLVHRADVRIGADDVKALEIVGYDDERDRYVTHAFDSQGNAASYELTTRGPCWTLAGEGERAAIEFGTGGKTMLVRWERLGPHRTWIPWMELKLTKAT